MSYCRWSTDDFRCDLYCYESDRGYETHVASRRRKYLAPVPAPVDWSKPEAALQWLERYQAVDELPFEWEACPTPPDGCWHYIDPDLPSFLARLESLRAAGFLFPDTVLDAVRAEIQEITR